MPAHSATTASMSSNARSRISNGSAILQLKLDQVSTDVGGIKRNLNTVTLTIVLAVLGAVVALVIK